MSDTRDDNRVVQVAVGVGILGLLTVTVCGVLIGWGYLPGLLGEWIGMMVGVVTTPFFMEASFIFIGLTLVVLINIWRRKKDGDECVYLEQVDGAEELGGLPDHAKFAVYREKPLPGETPSLQAQAEGAMAIGDHAAAAEWIGAMSEEELKCEETLFLRLELAKATGKSELAERLKNQVNAARNANG
jgi:uncharacterized membrane protein